MKPDKPIKDYTLDEFLDMLRKNREQPFPAKLIEIAKNYIKEEEKKRNQKKIAQTKEDIER